VPQNREANAEVGLHKNGILLQIT